MSEERKPSDDPVWFQVFMVFLFAAFAGLMMGGISYEKGAESRTAWIRADLAQQGCVLVQRDAGEGQTWMVECGEGE